MNTDRNPYGVKAGQVWADNDPRGPQRELVVVVVALHAEKPYAVVDAGRRTRVRLDRFRPTSNGYRLVRDVPA